MKDIRLENDVFCLTVGEDCIVKSLLLKATGEELLKEDSETALFSVTQERPYNNEIKLIHMNKETTFEANRVAYADGKLTVGFDITPFEAVVDVKIAPTYIAFTLDRFIVHETDYEHLLMDSPPVLSFRIAAIPVKEKKNFGEWLNVMWDETAAVCLLSTSPHAEIDSEKHKGYRTLTADAHRDILLEGCGCALIASAGGDAVLDAVEQVEIDYDLPRGVASRRNKNKINASMYWAYDVTPDTVDKHIAYAKKAGFRMMLIYLSACFKTENGWNLAGDYDLRDEYEGDIENFRVKVLDKIKAAGITPGFHFLHTHIGVKSRYVTPVADHRLHLKRHLTLAKPLGTDDTEIVVAQNPRGCPQTFEFCRALQFGGEIISYESYTTEPPYTFKGCKRGAFNTNIIPHEKGQIGGVLDMGEFGPSSLYLDQETDLMDEVAEKLAKAFNLGFEFVYFDGSEGTNAPFAFHIANAQYRVYKHFSPAPLFCEGAAKTHFSWHMLSGANAFDIFRTNIFKAMIDKHPVHEAPLMRRNFSRLNFGWWAFYEDTRPDVYEYGMSRAAAWDCPMSMQTNWVNFEKNPRTEDVFEVMRRWEDVREKDWLTEEQKEMMHTSDEHILLVNEEGEYELVPYFQVDGTPEKLYAFTFTRRGKNYAVYWYQGEDCEISLPMTDLVCEEALGGDKTAMKTEKGATVLPASHRRYISTSADTETLRAALRDAKIL